MFERVEEVPNRMDIGKDLTKRQQEIFDFIKRYSASHGYPPTVRDIGKAVGLASSSTVRASGPTGEAMVVCMVVITGDRLLA